MSRSPLRSQRPERELSNEVAIQDQKDRLVAQLRQEAMDLRQRERDYKNLQD